MQTITYRTKSAYTIDPTPPTKGPWFVDGNTMNCTVWVCGGDGKRVATMRKGPHDAANAKLIASAPALQKALQTIADMTHGATGGMHAEIYEIATAALIK